MEYLKKNIAAILITGWGIAFLFYVGTNLGDDRSTSSGSSSPPSPPAVKKETKSAEELHQEMIKPQFSTWDGSHHNLEKLIKESMKDPDSYQHVETRYNDMQNHLIVFTKYRGTNSFGGVVTNIVKAKVSLNGKYIEVLEGL